ncbi:MAG: hypothetical protein U9N57_14145 [Pseudomonadota bacterium]|nr:hypothetical protein [Pseudomonadota bacterium]
MFMKVVNEILGRHETSDSPMKWFSHCWGYFDLPIPDPSVEFINITTPDKMRKEILNQALSSLCKSGLDRRIIESVDTIEIKDLGEQLGFYRNESNTILVNENLIDRYIESGKPLHLSELCFVLAHEAAHVVDYQFGKRETGITSQVQGIEFGDLSMTYDDESQAYKVACDIDNKAVCLNEAGALLEKEVTHNAMFHYPFQYMFTNKNTFKAELFAQEFALKYTQSEFFKHHFPKSLKVIEDLENKALLSLRAEVKRDNIVNLGCK